ncbi:MAG: hypothetical protein EOO68_04885 [Moraxellaceae bacterium]|nr:MAG: hypothetical protein EOO68_04885 [Moraxellaceae bacterium]
MWQANFQTTTDISAEQLYKAITSIENWHQWDKGIEYTRLPDGPKVGSIFLLKPKDGPEVKITITKMWPFEMVEVAHLPLAKMKTTHKYIRLGDKTHIYIAIEITGLLAFLWRKVIGENQMREAGNQTTALINYARTL